MKGCYFFWGSILILAMGARAIIVTPYLPQSFLFQWDPQIPVPIPVTPQCETINITWGRSTAVGPNPTAPYYLEVYTSLATVPFIIPAGDGTSGGGSNSGNSLSFSWAVPFAPNTLYQICMFDALGNTGGCQATYTVILPLSTPNCTNVTYPPLLGVDANVDNGPLSQFGWVDQCTDISILPKNGTPPYTLTIAPALHPPYNITSHDMSNINWTVSLSYASPFFIGLFDSAGAMWSNGPLHSGGGGTIACLSGNITSSDLIKPGIAIGAGVGGLILGLLVGLAATYLFIRWSNKKKMLGDRFVDLVSSHGSPDATAHAHLAQDFHYRALPTASSSGIHPPVHTSTTSSVVHRTGGGSLQYHVEPFIMPDENGRLPTETRSIGQPVTTPTEPSSAQQQQSQVYVLHHDSNVPPVTIYHESGTEIVELPPRYPRHTSDDDALSEGSNRREGSRTDTSQPFILNPQRKPTQVAKSPR